MRSLTTFSKGLLAAGLLAGSLLSGCGPDYALFKVDVTSITSPRNTIVECLMTVTNENDEVVLDKYHLQPVYGPLDTSGNVTLSQGCGPGVTNAKIGTLSYSSSRTGGTLTFRVDAWDSNGLSCGYSRVAPCLPVQTGTSDPATPAKFPPEVPVTVVIK